MTNDHEARIARNEEVIQDLWKAVEEIKSAMLYRLPLWATIIISFLTMLVGWLGHAVLR